MVKSWKTTVAGWLAGLIILMPQLSILFNGIALGQPMDELRWEAILVAIGLILGGTFARDNSVTSEQAGVA